MPSKRRLQNLFSRAFTTPERTYLVFCRPHSAGNLVSFFFFFSAAKGRLVDALFTATSAVCVTELATIDIGRVPLAGQDHYDIAQVGSCAACACFHVFFVLMGRGISFKGREIVQSTFPPSPPLWGDFLVILKSVLRFHNLLKMPRGSAPLGPVLPGFPDRPLPGGLSFDLRIRQLRLVPFSDSLALVVNLTVMAVIVIGGIGFIVQYEVFARFRKRQNQLSVHTKIVLIATILLILVRAAILFCSKETIALKTYRSKIKSWRHSSNPYVPDGRIQHPIGLLANETILLFSFSCSSEPPSAPPVGS